MADIKKLLNKKGWTGRELGIIEITNMCHVFRQRMEGNTNPTPLVEMGQFQKMVNTSIKDRVQGAIYNGYISIHEWISLHYNIALSFEQQAQLQFKSLKGYITNAMLAEDIYQYIESLPLIMTEKQYEAEKAKRRREWMYQEDGVTPVADDAIALIYRAFEYYADLLTTDPKKANPLKPIRKKYLTEQIESPLIRSRYIEAAEYGYWITEDGLRSDQMTDAEWKEITEAPKVRHLDGDMMAYIDKLQNESIDDARDLLNGKSPVDIYRDREQAKIRDGRQKKTTFVLYDHLPEDLNKWDFLTDGIVVYEVFHNSLGGQAQTDEAYQEEVTDFAREFSEMIYAIVKDIDKQFFGGTPTLSVLPASEWQGFIVDWEQLYEKSYYNFREWMDEEWRIWDGNMRAQRNGVAIIKPEGEIFGKYTGIDEKGYYFPPEVNHTVLSHSIESLFPEAEDYAYKAEEIEEGREALLDSYYYIMGYNKAIDLIAEYFEIPEIKVFKLNLERLQRQISALNDLVPVLYRQIYYTQYEDESLKERKLEVLKNFFGEIEYKKLSIPQSAIDTAVEAFQEFRAFKERDLADILFYRTREEPDLFGEEVPADEE